MSDLKHRISFLQILDQNSKTIKLITWIDDLKRDEFFDANVEIKDGKLHLNSDRSIYMFTHTSKDSLLNKDLSIYFNESDQAEIIVFTDIEIKENDKKELAFFIHSQARHKNDNSSVELNTLQKSYNEQLSESDKKILTPITNFTATIESKLPIVRNYYFSLNINQSFSVAVEELNEEVEQIYNLLIKEFINQDQDFLSDLSFIRPLRQKNYEPIHALTYPTNKTARAPFIKNNPNFKNTGQLQRVNMGIRLGKDSQGEWILNKLSLSIDRQLDFMDYLVLSAFYTLKRENPDLNGVSFLDIANMLVKTRTGKRLNSNDKFVEVVKNSCMTLMGTVATLDFSSEAEAYKNKNERIKQYLDDGGNGQIAFNYIYARVKPIKVPNGKILDGLEFTQSQTDNLFYEYLDRSGQIRTLSGDTLINPLPTFKVNVELFHYLLNRLAGMPYDQASKGKPKKKINLLTAKQEYLRKAETEGKRNAKTAVDYSGTLKYQRSLADSQLTINIDKLIEELNLTSAKRNRIYAKIENILDYWIKTGLISRYTPNSKGRRLESYTIYIF